MNGYHWGTRRLTARRRRAGGLAGIVAMVGWAVPAWADSFASAQNDVIVSLTGGSSTIVEWNADPAGRYLNSQAYVDHSDVGPAGSLVQNSEFYNPGGASSVFAGPVSEGALSSVDHVSAEWLANGAHLRIGAPGGTGPDGLFVSVGSGQSDTAYADARAELSNVFRLTRSNPGDPSPTGTFFFQIAGGIGLSAFNLPPTGFAESLLSVRVYDATGQGDPLFAWSRFDRVDTDNPGPVSSPLAYFSDPITLSYDQDYLFEVIDDKEAQVPEPAAGLVAMLLAAATGRRARKDRRTLLTRCR